MKLFSNLNLVLLIAIYSFSDKAYSLSSEDSISDYLEYNLGSGRDAKYIRGWFRPMSSEEILYWGSGMRLQLIHDKGPIVDNRARFISKLGSHISITGLNYHKRYRIWIEFVIFHNTDNIFIPALLKIIIDGKLLRTLKFGSIAEDENPYMIEIPFELTTDGKIDLLFKEQSTSGGFFGVWDIILSDRIKPLREIINFKFVEEKGIKVRDRIIENRPEPVKDKRIRIIN
ncbi:MAG: hypothetical protein SVZ03_00275 [Spirochaetota bacterium]|nr:hypothetical protein [Spirochaetota bacterium]